MSLKLLTVDDSKAVRMIVKKAFKSFDCEVLEAANGVEGLAVAAKDGPDMILLDVTMPVMDGVEMLTKLKGDAQTKGIPVVMLTAEAGRENVMKIAKIGIRDYVVKPFKEEVLIEKVGRIIDLRPKETNSGKRKCIDDPIEVLVVEDKPAIIKQIQEKLAETAPWKVTGVETHTEALEHCQGNLPDIVVASLSLPENAAFELFRNLRANVKTKYLPIFGMAVKTATHEQQEAQQAGFTSIITKPIDYADLVSKIAKSINLDTSSRFYRVEEDTLIIQFPATSNSSTVTEVESALGPKLAEAVDNGLSQVAVDASVLGKVETETIKLWCEIVRQCAELTLPVKFVASDAVTTACGQYEETRAWKFVESMDALKAETASA